MTKIDITRTELVWPGKYDEAGNLVTPRRVNLPFQVIERVSETRATRAERQEHLAGHVGTLFDYWQVDKALRADTNGDGWRNKLIWGDNLYVISSLLEQFAGQIDLIYIDPPFATGADFSYSAQIGEERDEIAKQQSILEEKAYRDTWGAGVDSYLNMMLPRLKLMYELLSQSGSLFVHCDYHVSHYLRALLDEVFGYKGMRSQIAWKSAPGHSDSSALGVSHNVIHFYTKSPTDYIWNPKYQPYDEEYLSDHYQKRDPDGRRFEDEDLTAYGLKGGGYLYEWKGVTKLWRRPIESMQELEAGGLLYYTQSGLVRKKRYLDQMPGAPLSDLWSDIPRINSQALERQGYDTQKPESLLTRIIEMSSNEGALVADFFIGSGTTAAVAEKLRRRWIACDLGRYAIHTSRKRLMDIPDCRPFEILNLGKYERQVWQGVAFGGRKQSEQLLIFEYLKFILELYGAQPLAGTQHLHGKKKSAVVHVGAVDAPVTIDEINVCLAECLAMGQKELHILGWEWEMGLANLMVDEARRQGVRLLLLNIPREVMEQQAVDKGDIHFYELAYLEAKPTTKGRTVTVALTDFVIPNDELIPADVRQKIAKWSDYVDYWAVDWDFRDDTFVNGWTSYRTRQDRKLELKTEPHAYDGPGTYHVLVKVIDIFGNDTSQRYEVVIV